MKRMFLSRVSVFHPGVLSAALLQAGGLLSVHGAVTTVGAVAPVPPAGGGPYLGAANIGDSAFGSVSVSGGTALSANGGLTIGNNVTGTGLLALSGFGSDWTQTSAGTDITLADEGTDSLTLTGGAVASVPDDVIMAAQATGSGRISVSGLGSRVAVGDDLTAGLRGAATVDILSSGQLTCDTMFLGDLATASAALTVSGDLSRLTTGAAFLGDAGHGSVQVTNGGRWTCGGDLTIGNTAGSTGRLEVTGQGAVVQVSGLSFIVGAGGSGTVVIGAGGTLINDSFLHLASAAAAGGSVEIQEGGTLLSVQGFSTGLGRGQLTIAAGGLLRTEALSNVSVAGRVIMAGGTWESPAAGNALFLFGEARGSGVLQMGTVTVTSSGNLHSGAGQELKFTGTLATAGVADIQGGALTVAGTVTNTGACNLHDGTLTGGGLFTNSASTGLITARDARLLFEGGLSNQGSLTAAAGISELWGDITNAATGRIAVSGGATALFYDDVNNSGILSVSAAGGLTSAAVFFGSFSGNGVSGTGHVFLEGDARPGFSPGVMAFGGDVTYGPLARTVLEIGGTAPGTQYDRLTVAGAFHRDGELAVSLIGGYVPAVGASFDVLDFTPALTTGSFTSLTLPALPADRAWDTSALPATGVLKVVSAQSLTFLQWATAQLSDPAAQPTGDHDFDGSSNLVEFALGLFPPVPGTVQPVVDTHDYGDGLRYRIRFTRPLDRTGVTLRVQASGDLVTWTDLATSVDSAPFTGPGFVSEDRAHPLPDPGPVEVRDTVTIAGTPRRYIRLLLTLP